MHIVQESFKDDGNNEYVEGDVVLRGIWYDKLSPNSHSYLLRNDKSLAYVFSHLILASKFPMLFTSRRVKGIIQIIHGSGGHHIRRTWSSEVVGLNFQISLCHFLVVIFSLLETDVHLYFLKFLYRVWVCGLAQKFHEFHFQWACVCGSCFICRLGCYEDPLGHGPKLARHDFFLEL